VGQAAAGQQVAESDGAETAHEGAARDGPELLLWSCHGYSALR
jgi:hypothetical protein